MPFFKRVDFLAIGFTRSTLALFLIYITYLLFGSLCFVLIEAAHEMKARSKTFETIRMTQVMVQKLRDANYSDDNISAAFVTQREIKVKAATNATLSWHEMFGEKVFFSFILISTIGYGNVTPKSAWGQCVCVLFTMFGLPIHAIMMRLLSVKFRGSLRHTFKVGLRFFPGSRMVLFIIGFMFFMFCSAIFLFIPSYVIVVTEKWDYCQAFYFSYVSLTTIGLGDYVLGFNENNPEGFLYALGIIVMLLWMFLGLAFMAMSLGILSYLMGKYTLNKLDCKCRQRTAAMARLSVLLELMKELNWQLVKGKPDDFKHWDEVENFKDVLAENPHDVDAEMLNRMFEVIVGLKEDAFDQISRMKFAAIPESSLIQRAKESREKGILGTESVVVHTPETSEQQVEKKSPEESRRILEEDKKNALSNAKSLNTRPLEPKTSLKSPDSLDPLSETDADINEDERESVNGKSDKADIKDMESSEDKEKKLN